MKRLLFIFNPLSGKNRIQAQLFRIIEFYTDQGYLVTVYPTKAAGDGYDCIKNMSKDFDLIVCSGGDGTLNEIVSGILDGGKNTAIGYIPSGSTNDFGKSAGIPMDIEEAMEISCFGKPEEFDIGRLNDRYFVYVAAFGAFTKVSYTTPQKMKNVLGYLAYVLLGIKELSELRAYNMMIEYDHKKVEGEFIIGLIMNSFSIGGFKNPIGGLTELNDGMFEGILIRMPQNLMEFQEIVAALIGNQDDSKLVIRFQAAYIHIQSEPIEWTVDGEYGGCYEEATIENLNRAVKVFVKGN